MVDTASDSEFDAYLLGLQNAELDADLDEALTEKEGTPLDVILGPMVKALRKRIVNADGIENVMYDVVHRAIEALTRHGHLEYTGAERLFARLAAELALMQFKPEHSISNNAKRREIGRQSIIEGVQNGRMTIQDLTRTEEIFGPLPDDVREAAAG